MKQFIAIFVLLTIISASISHTPCECGGGFEVYTTLGGACDQTCWSLGEPCPIWTLVPVKGCRCLEGYARNKWGICVEISECNKTTPCECGGGFEEYTLGLACDQTCWSLGEPCPIWTLLPVNGCRCLEDTPCECGGGAEEYTTLGGACDLTCWSLDEPCPIMTFVPVKGCRCVEGYARNKWGICVEISECNN
nr:uncharacterized protein LOC111417214 [Onthophagus taurus]